MELKCPKCQTVFKVDDREYASIVEQVRNAELEKEVNRRIDDMERRLQAEEQARSLIKEKETSRRLAEQESHTQNLMAKKDAELNQLSNELTRLRGQVANSEATRREAVALAEVARQKELAELRAGKDREIDALRLALERKESERIAAVNAERESQQQQRHEQDKTIASLQSQLQSQRLTAENELHQLRERHETALREKDEALQYYKDLKTKMSTKMLGETLEQHCQTMFNRARSYGQFPTAYFEKDNDASQGSKGDFIFRDYLDGKEYISIMFEMKNEDSATATKHRNEDFFAKLDKDRRTKECEYAVLVSTLEADSDYYNEGIVDVSYRYEKMLVIRPQHFMSVIVMLSNGARRGALQLIDMGQKLAEAKSQSIDVTNFERRRDMFAEGFRKLVDAHLKKQDDAMAELDKAIAAAEKQAENLRKIKSAFEASRTKIVKANDKIETDFTIKKLTHGNRTMKILFEEARQQSPQSDNEDYERFDD